MKMKLIDILASSPYFSWLILLPKRSILRWLPWYSSHDGHNEK